MYRSAGVVFTYLWIVLGSRTRKQPILSSVLKRISWFSVKGLSLNQTEIYICKRLYNYANNIKNSVWFKDKPLTKYYFESTNFAIKRKNEFRQNSVMNVPGNLIIVNRNNFFCTQPYTFIYVKGVEKNLKYIYHSANI